MPLDERMSPLQQMPGFDFQVTINQRGRQVFWEGIDYQYALVLEIRQYLVPPRQDLGSGGGAIDVGCLMQRSVRDVEQAVISQ